jgi:hypothetical protein
MRQKQPTMTMSAELRSPYRFGRLRDGTPVLLPVSARFDPHEDSPDWPAVELDLDLDDSGRPVITRVSLIGTPDRPLDSNAVRTYSLEKLSQFALADVTLRLVRPGEHPEGVITMIDGGESYVSDRSRDAWERVVRAVRQRTVIGRDRLADVARFYAAGGLKAVEDNLSISRAQAYRLVADARVQGMLETGRKG